MKTLPKKASDRVKFGKCLTGIKNAPNSDGIICQFKDGTEEGPFDLVIGSDGVNSAVKEYVDNGDITQGGKKENTIYSGIRIQYAVQDGVPNDENVDSSELVQYFGDAAYALGAIYGAGEGRKPTKTSYLIFRDPEWNPFAKDEELSAEETPENADWTQGVESLGSLMSSRIKECGVPDNQIGPVVKNSDRFFELGVYFHNPFSLRGWSREVKGSGRRFVVLAGDAAHASKC